MIIIVGAGISGLTAAQKLPRGVEPIILEKTGTIGGLSTQYRSNQYEFDYGGHYFHFQNNLEIKNDLEQFCDFAEFKRKSKTYLSGRYIPFPVQFHLGYLPSKLKSKILDEILLTPPTPSTGANSNLYGYLEAHFGTTLLDLFFKPFLKKYYLQDLNELAADMDKGSIPIPDKTQIEAGAHGEKFAFAGYNPRLYYPKRSLRYFIERYAANVKHCIRFNEEVLEVDTLKKTVRTPLRQYPYETLVSSMPLNELLNIVKPAGLFPGAHLLKYVSTLVTNVILKKRSKRFHWAYLAEERFPFYRVGFYARHPFPACYLERNIRPGAVIDRKKLREEVIYTLMTLKVIRGEDEVVYIDSRVIPVGYVVFDKHWREIVPAVLEKLENQRIYSIGRYGQWNYSSMSMDIHAAYACAQEIAAVCRPNKP